MYDENHLAHAISRASDGRHDAVFLTDFASGDQISYGQFWANADRMAAMLQDRGVKPGDRVAVQTPKDIAMLELYVGTVLAGAVFLPLNTGYTPDEVAYFLTDAAPRIFVCDPKRLEALQPVAQTAGVRHVLTLGLGGTGSLIPARDAMPSGFEPVPRGPLDLAAILYTSGTTGRSKGAMLTHRALASNSDVLRAYWQFTDQDDADGGRSGDFHGRV